MAPKKPTNGDVEQAVHDLSEQEAEELLQMPEVQKIINGRRTLKA